MGSKKIKDGVEAKDPNFKSSPGYVYKNISLTNIPLCWVEPLSSTHESVKNINQDHVLLPGRNL